MVGRKTRRAKLTDRRRLAFATAYVLSLNARQAAIDAGYAPRRAAVTGCELLKSPDIQALVRHQSLLVRTREDEKTELTGQRVLEELRRLSFSDIRTLFDEHGNILPMHKLTKEQAACISSLEVVKKNLQSGDRVTDTIYKVKMWDKTKSLEMLAKHFALLTERVEVTMGSELLARLDRGRTRAQLETHNHELPETIDVPKT